MARHYKSWSSLNKQLCDFLCPSLKDRVSFFLTRYHRVHDSYGRAAIRLDGQGLVCFSWIEKVRQESDLSAKLRETGRYVPDDPELKERWAWNCTYCEMDFLNAALDYLDMPVEDAIRSDQAIIRILAVLDRRIGKRTLQRIYDEKEYLDYPQWQKQFYELRFAAEHIS